MMGNARCFGLEIHLDLLFYIYSHLQLFQISTGFALNVSIWIKPNAIKYTCEAIVLMAAGNLPLRKFQLSHVFA